MRNAISPSPISCTDKLVFPVILLLMLFSGHAFAATYDYGDAPATYGDADHVITSGIQLGALAPDSEAASQYTFNALGDGDDEDGAPHPVAPAGPAKAALFPVLKVTDSSYTTPITVTNTTGAAGTLYGWIDFDKSGTFEADEASSVAVPTGSNNATVNLTWSSIPADIELGTTFIRLRLTTDTTVTTSTPTGDASDGEVEDYPIAIYQDIPPNSNALKIVTGDTPLACQTKVFEDNFNDVPEISWGANRAGSQDIRNWVRGGGGSDTYAAVENIDATQKTAVYFGTGTMRGISPSIPTGFTFDANGKLTTPLDAIALRDIPDDVSSITDEAIWGPYPVTLSRSFPTQIGKTYRLYFKAIPETDSSYVYSSGIMRVDITGSDTQSIHFKAPGSAEGTLDYAIEFTATEATSTLTFVNYGHVDDGTCDPQQTAWCTIGGTTDGSNPNELIIDDVVLAEADCNNASISGTVYTDTNSNDSYDSATETGIGSITVTLKNNADNSTIATTSTDVNGAYSFDSVDSALTYRIEVDAADTDLSGKIIGTTNPLTNIIVTAGGAITGQNFGFDLLFPTSICGKTIDNPLSLDFSGTATLVSGTAKQPGSVYRFSNVAAGVDALVTMNALQADTLPRWLDGDLGGQLQGTQTDKFFDMTVNLVATGTSTAISPADLILTSFDLDGLAGEPYSDGVEYFSPTATFTGVGSQLQALDMGGSIRYTLPTSARGVDDPTAADPTYAAGAVYNDVTSFRTKGLVVDDNSSSTRSIFIYANSASFKQFGALECDPVTSTNAAGGIIFEDINYGGSAGRSFGTSGTTGISGATVELYSNAGQYLKRTSSTAGGSYNFGALSDGKYYIRVVNDTVSSSRSGSDGSELGIQTYRSSDAGAVTNEIGGHNPAVADAPANTTNLKLNTSSFKFPSGEQAQSVQAITVVGGNVSGVNFGFNFDTIVNTKDSGQGSLRQFLLNADLLGNDNTLAQAGLTAGKENAVLMLPTTDPNYNTAAKYWSIALLSALPEIKTPLILDGSIQSGFTKTPVLELNGNGAGAGVKGLTLAAGSNGSRLSNLAINRFKGAGIYINGSNSNTIQANRIGTNPAGDTARGNGGSGILLNAASNNLIGDSTGVAGNLIANNGNDGVSITGATSSANTIMGNSIHTNTGIGIDLNDDSVTANDEEDLDSGPNSLLNYPDVISTSFGANGSKIITYDFNLDLPNNTNGYRIDFYKNAVKDSTGFGEGQTWLGSKDFTHPGGGTLNYKGSFNANLSASSNEYIAATVTEKTSPLTYGNTSEFSGSTNNNSVIVCTDLLSNPGAALPDQVLDENAPVVTYLKAIDKKGNPLTYIISGGADANMFTVGAVTDGTTDCTQIRFVKSVIVKNAPSTPRAVLPGLPDPGNYEIPMDSNKDNVYEIEITATDIDGVKYVRTLNTRVMDVNEAPIIISGADVSLEEDGSTQVLDINTQDQDAIDTEGNGLIYSLSGGADQAQFALDTSTGVLNFKTVPDYDAPTDSNQDNVYEVEVTVTDHGGLTASKIFNITITNRTADDGVKLKARAILQGAYDSATGLMGNELNALGLLPTNQPYAVSPFNYTGAEVLGTPAMSGTDNDAVVDWMLIDLRTSQSNIVSSRAVLLQRDGDLVDALSGSPILHFPNVIAGNYYVSVRHRNHLGVMTASPVSLSSTETLIDFSLTSTAVNGTETRYTSSNLAMLWVGDINGNGTLTSNGPSNDITSLLSSVVTSSANPQAYTNFTLKGYLPSDLNMDGSTLFSGPNNDANVLIGNVILHPLNSNFAANYIVRGGL